MFHLFSKKKNDPETAATAISVAAPTSGTLVALTEVPDPVFSGGLMGPGFAVAPTEGEFCAPIAGEIIALPDTAHAFGIRGAQGLEILVHIGVDTVGLKGEGFTAHHAVGDRVEAGDAVITVDLAEVAGKVPSVLTPVIVTNADGFTVTVTLDNTESPMQVRHS